jgi:hypothetical protein
VDAEVEEEEGDLEVEEADEVEFDVGKYVARNSESRRALAVSMREWGVDMSMAEGFGE